MPDESLDEQISDATLVLKGYREALQAVKVNGTSMIVINTLSDLVLDARDKRYELIKLKENRGE
jgi:hypothetical protein